MALIPEGMGRPTQPFGQGSNPGALDNHFHLLGLLLSSDASLSFVGQLFRYLKVLIVQSLEFSRLEVSTVSPAPDSNIC